MLRQHLARSRSRATASSHNRATAGSAGCATASSCNRMTADSRNRTAAGSVSLEFALIYGLLLAMVLVVAHVALLYNANLTVADAADAALEELTQKSGSVTAAQSVAEFISQDVPMSGFEVRFWHEDQGGPPVRVFVNATARSPELLPGLPVEVSYTASGVLEQFITEQERVS